MPQGSPEASDLWPFTFAPDDREQVARPLRLMLKDQRRPESEADAIVVRLEAIVDLLSPLRQRTPDSAARAAAVRGARTVIEALKSMSIGTPDEVEATRRVLLRIVRVFGREGHRPQETRKRLLRDSVQATLREAGLPYRYSKRAVEVISAVERVGFGDAPKYMLEALRRSRRLGQAPARGKKSQSRS